MSRTIHFAFVIFILTLLTACATLSVEKSDLAIIGPTYELAEVFNPVEHRPLLEKADMLASVPEVKLILPPDPPPPPAIRELHESVTRQLSEEEITCIARNMYHEARGEGSRGMIAVGYVVLNRMASPKYRSRNACQIVYQPYQFSWTRMGLNVGRDAGSQASYRQALALARAVAVREVENPIDDSIYFHGKHLRPAHARASTLRAVIGGHRFHA